MIYVGIDLGTTFSMISHVNIHGVPSLFPDAHDASEFRTPSVVIIGPYGCQIGSAAEDMLNDEPELPVIRFAKLHMGLEKTIFVDQKRNEWSPEAVSALILRKLVNDAESYSGEAVGAAVITVPAQFGDAERRATQHAGWLAGIKNVHIVDEPVAAATYYGASVDKKKEQTLFVYDLGGGTFDATVLHSSPEGLFVLATEGSADLGGKRFDEAIMAVAAQQLRGAESDQLLADPASNLQLRRFAEQIKIKLSKPGIGHIRQTLLLSNQILDFVMTRGQLEKLVRPYIEETINISERCLSGSGLSWNSIDGILLVGGSTLIPLVQDMLKTAVGDVTHKITSRQPHQAVAFGASMIANQRSGQPGLVMPKLVQQIAPSDVGMRVRDPRTGEPAISVLIPRNTPLPAEHSSTYYTSRADQTRMVLEFVELKGAESHERSLGFFSFGPIDKPQVNYPVEVTIVCNEEGLLKVRARDLRTSREMNHSIERNGQSDAAKLKQQSDLVMSLQVG